MGDVKEGLSQKCGLKREHQKLYLDHEEREEDLQDDGEGLRGMRRAREETITMSVLMEVADAQAVVPGLKKEATAELGDGEPGYGDDQFRYPQGAVWVPSQSDWLITTEVGGHRVKVTNVRTGVNCLQVWPARRQRWAFQGSYGRRCHR